MGIGKASSIVGALAFAAALGGGTNAHADASLTLTPVSSQCFTYSWGAGPGGVPLNQTSSWACDPSPTAPVAMNNGRSYTFPSGWRSWMQVVYDFSYNDDGLPLDSPRWLVSWLVSTEAGLILAWADTSSGAIVDISASGDVFAHRDGFSCWAATTNPIRSPGGSPSTFARSESRGRRESRTSAHAASSPASRRSPSRRPTH